MTNTSASGPRKPRRSAPQGERAPRVSPSQKSDEFVADEFAAKGADTRESQWLPLILNGPDELMQLHAQSPAAKQEKGMRREEQEAYNIARSELINAFFEYKKSHTESTESFRDISTLALLVEEYETARENVLRQLIGTPPDTSSDRYPVWEKKRKSIEKKYITNDESRINTEVARHAVGEKEQPAITDNTDILPSVQVPPTQKSVGQEDLPVPAPEPRVEKEERREPSIQKPPLSDAEKRARDRIFGVREAARKAYRSYAEFLEKESGKGGEEHNRLRKDYTEALATYLAAQVRIIETNARIDHGPYFAEKESYQNHIAELYSSAVVHGNEQLVRMDPSFDPHAALLSDSKLYATFSQACEGKVLGPAKGIFSVLEEPVLEEVQDMIGKNTVQAFYVARIEHVLALNAEHAGYPDQSPSSLPEEFQRPVGTTQDTTNKHVTYAHMRSMVLRQLEVYAKNAATPEQKERIRQVRQALKSDAEVLNAVKHYWLTGYKKRRVKPTGEELKKHGKGKIRTWALATLAGMFAIFTPAPSGDRQTDSRPELEDSEETRETRRREGVGYEPEESYASEPFILQANSEGASATFAQMLSKLRPERRDALMQGLGIPTNIHRREQAARMSELLGFTNVRADGRSVRVFTDTYFVLSPRGLEIQRAGDTQVLVNSENKKVAEYVER